MTKRCTTRVCCVTSTLLQRMTYILLEGRGMGGRIADFSENAEILYCIAVGSRRLMPPDAMQPKAYCTNPGL